MKRAFATFLWFLVGWYLGSAAAWAFGLGPLVGPVGAVILAALVVTDPLGMIWARSRVDATTSGAPITASPDTHTV